jgi:hypothetical protein
MRTNRTLDQWNNWCLARNRIDEELKNYYRACTTKELPPRLLTLLEKLDNQFPEEQPRPATRPSLRLD